MHLLGQKFTRVRDLDRRVNFIASEDPSLDAGLPELGQSPSDIVLELVFDGSHAHHGEVGLDLGFESFDLLKQRMISAPITVYFCWCKKVNFVLPNLTTQNNNGYSNIFWKKVKKDKVGKQPTDSLKFQ